MADPVPLQHPATELSTGKLAAFTKPWVSWFSYVDRQLRNPVHQGYKFAGLPPNPSDYTRAFVTDSTQTLTAGIGTACAGGGANKVPVFSISGVWTIG